MTDCENCKYALILKICDTAGITRIKCLFYGNYVVLNEDEVCTHYEGIE